jgi:ribosomal protein S18
MTNKNYLVVRSSAGSLSGVIYQVKDFGDKMPKGPREAAEAFRANRRLFPLEELVPSAQHREYNNHDSLDEFLGKIDARRISTAASKYQSSIDYVSYSLYEYIPNKNPF